MHFNIEFMLPEGKGRLPSRMFFTSLDRLGINVNKYMVPSNWMLEPDDIQLYTDAILYDLLCYVREGGVKNGDYDYAKGIVGILKSWGDKNYTISVV